MSRQQDYDLGFDNGYEIGWSKGRAEGFDEGYTACEGDTDREEAEHTQNSQNDSTPDATSATVARQSSSADGPPTITNEVYQPRHVRLMVGPAIGQE